MRIWNKQIQPNAHTSDGIIHIYKKYGYRDTEHTDSLQTVNIPKGKQSEGTCVYSVET